jgi:hypothetical protein
MCLKPTLILCGNESKNNWQQVSKDNGGVIQSSGHTQHGQRRGRQDQVIVCRGCALRYVLLSLRLLGRPFYFLLLGSIGVWGFGVLLASLGGFGIHLFLGHLCHLGHGIRECAISLSFQRL